MASLPGLSAFHALDPLPPPEAGLPTAPYPGLRSFRLDEWPIFFGREIATDEVLEQLEDAAFIMVHGSSGCGKSSLIYAGMLPRMITRAQQRGSHLAVAQMRPGSTPLSSLSTALAVGLGRDHEEQLIYRILNRGRDAAPNIRDYIREAGFNEFCLYVDQFEELFRLAVDEEEADLFVEALVGLSGIRAARRPWWRSAKTASTSKRRKNQDPVSIRIVATMRSEFFGDCAKFRELAELVNRTQYLLPPMREFDLERAIRDPAELYGRFIERPLALELVREAAQESDPLPLIQHALMLMWKSSETNLMIEDYRDLANGNRFSVSAHSQHGSKTNLSRIFANHVDWVADPQGNRADIAETLIRALVNIDAQRRATRRPQYLATLIELVGPENEDTLRKLIDDMRAEGASFLRPFERDCISPLPKETLIDISHEALFRAWPRAADPSLDPDTNEPKGWLFREYEDGLVWRALAVQARAHRQNPAELLGSAATSRQAEWFERTGSRATWAERHLIERVDDLPPSLQPEWLGVRELIEESARKVECVAFEGEREAAKRRRIRRWQWTASCGLLLVTLAATVAAAIFNIRAQTSAAQAETLQLQRRTENLDRQLTAAQNKINRLEAFVWLGSDGNSKVLSARTGAAVQPSALQEGDRVRVVADAMVRSGVPDSDTYTLAQGRGYLKRGSTVTIAAAPVAIRRAGRNQYWARIEGSAIAFGALRIYYTGNDLPGSNSDNLTDARAARLAKWLTDYGFRIETLQRQPRAAGIAEIRFFQSRDIDQAQILSGFVNYVTEDAGLAKAAAKPRVRDFGGSEPQSATGLEIWIDLGGSEVPQRGRRFSRAPAVSPSPKAPLPDGSADAAPVPVDISPPE